MHAMQTMQVILTKQYSFTHATFIQVNSTTKGRLIGKSFIYSFTLIRITVDYPPAPCLTHNLGEGCVISDIYCTASILVQHSHKPACNTNQLHMTKHTHADLTSTTPHNTERKSHAKHSRVSKAITNRRDHRLWILCAWGKLHHNCIYRAFWQY